MFDFSRSYQIYSFFCRDKYQTSLPLHFFLYAVSQFFFLALLLLALSIPFLPYLPVHCVFAVWKWQLPVQMNPSGSMVVLCP